jgi:Protein of unknown function (DUF2612)
MSGLGGLPFGLGGTLLLQSISIAPVLSSVALGSSVQLVATGHYNDGSAVNITASSVWSSSDVGVVVINGLATGLVAGTSAHIVAAFGGLTGDAFVRVQQAAQQPTDHIAGALSRLPIQFEDKPNLIGVLTCFLQPIQELENALVDVIVQRSVLNAIGVTLRMLGKLVGQDYEDGLSDDDFRRLVMARIAKNKSTGSGPDILRIARLLVDPGMSLELQNRGTAAFVLKIGSQPVSATLASIVAKFIAPSASAGVRAVVESSQSTPSNTFRFDSGPGYDVGHYADSTEG